jgi:hypothetical protein
VLIAGSAQRYARTPPRPVRRALRGPLAQPLPRGGATNKWAYPLPVWGCATASANHLAAVLPSTSAPGCRRSFGGRCGTPHGVHLPFQST